MNRAREGARSEEVDMPEAVLAVYANPSDPARDDESNTWYTETHIPEVLALDGFVAQHDTACQTRARRLVRP